MTISYIEKYRESNTFMFEQEVFKILKQINTIQFVINQMFLELSSFKTNCTNINTDIEKYHHNCKVVETKKIDGKKFSFCDPNYAKLMLEESDDENNDTVSNVNKSAPLNTYRVWKDK
jgi:hypothetical protein